MSNKDPSVFIFIFMNSLFLLDFRRSVMTEKVKTYLGEPWLGDKLLGEA